LESVTLEPPTHIVGLPTIATGTGFTATVAVVPPILPHPGADAVNVKVPPLASIADGIVVFTELDDTMPASEPDAVQLSV
jgi:hypothetical protein